MPVWKKPFWYWIKWFNAWPVSVEALSGVFDFNRAPFFQSFMEVRVERSKKRVALILHGVQGPLHWRDLQMEVTSAAGSDARRAGRTPGSDGSRLSAGIPFHFGGYNKLHHWPYPHKISPSALDTPEKKKSWRFPFPRAVPAAPGRQPASSPELKKRQKK